MFHSIGSAIIITDANGLIEWVNRAFTETSGYTLAEVVGRRPGDFLQGEHTDPAVVARMHEALVQQRGFDENILNYRKDGVAFEFHLVVEPVFDARGKLIRFIGTQTDLEEHARQSREALHAVRDRLASTVDALIDGVMILAPDQRILDCNPAAARILGTTRKALLDNFARDFAWDFVDADGKSLPLDARPAARALATGQAVENFEVRVMPIAGPPAWLLINALPTRNLDGSLSGVVVSFRDITQEKYDEQSLQLSNELLRTIQATSRVGGWDWNLTTDAIFWTNETYRLFETTPDEYTPVVTDIGRFIVPSDGPGHRSLIRETIIKGKPFETDVRLLTAKGREIWVHTICTPTVVNGRTVRLTGAFQDISESRRAQETLSASEQRYRTLVEHSPYCIHEIDRDGRLTSMNASGLKMMGLDDECAVQAKPYLDSVCDRDRPRIAGLLSEAISGNESEFVFQSSNGQVFQSSFVPITDESGIVQRLMGLTIDISAQHNDERLQSALFRISDASHQSSNLDDLYQRIHAIISELMPAQNIYIALLDTERDEISFPYWVDDVDPRPEPRRFSDGGGLTNWVLRHGEPLLLTPQSTKDGRLPDGSRLIGTDSIDWLGVPLKVHGEALGVLAVQSYSGDVRYQQSHLELLQFVSNEIAVAVARQRSNDLLRDNEEKYRSLFDQSPVYTTLIELPEGRFVQVNDACLAAFGYERQDVIGKTTLDFGAWHDARQRELFFEILREQGSVRDFEAVMLRKDHTPITVLYTSTRLRIGSRDFVLNLLLDVSERRLIETRLRDNEEKFRLVFDQSPSMIALLGFPNGEFVEVNDAGVNAFGHTRDGMIGRTSVELNVWVNPQDRVDYLNVVLEQGSVKNFETTMRRKNGEHFMVLMNGSLISLGGRQLLLNSLEDITERKLAEIHLRESEEQFKSTFENSAVGVALVSLEGRWLRVNPSVCELTGYPEQELLGLTFQDITHPDDLEADLKYVTQLLAGEIENYRMEKRYLRKDGAIVWVLLAVSLVRDQAGQPRHFISQIEDISARISAQRELESANRSLEQTRHLLEASQYAAQVGGWELDVGLDTLFWTDETYRIHDLSPDEHTPSVDTAISFYSPESAQALLGALHHAREEGTPYDLELELVSALGRHVWVRTTGSVTRVQERIIKIGGAIQDITERKKAEQWQQHYSQILAMITAETPLSSVLDALSRFIEQHSEGAYCSILLLSADDMHLRHGAAPSLPDFVVQAIDGIAIGDTGAGACGAAALRGVPVLVEDFAESTLMDDWQELAERAELRACWSIPILSSERKVIGTFAIYHRKPWAPDPDDEELLRRSTSLAALAIDRARHQEAQRLATTVFEENIEGVMVTAPDDRILMVNRAFESLTGYAAEEAVGQTPATLLDSGRHDQAFWTEISDQLRMTSRWEGEVWSRRKNGEIYPVRMSIAEARDNAGIVTQRITIMTDVSLQKVQAARIEQLAFYDVLTGLPNRALFLDRLEHILASAQRHGERGAILFLDLDRFKEINDSKGHAIGDLALAEAARRFLAATRREETLARLGGDEFVLIAEGADHRSASLIAARLLQSLSEPLILMGAAHTIGTSIGIAFYPDDGTTSEELIKHTDIAMYRAKSAGGGYRFYQAAMGEELEKRLGIAQKLGPAMEANQLQLYYQPKIELATGTLIGAEALLRWKDPEWGWISPGEFIPIAEQRGMMKQLGDWVLREGCKQLRRWRDLGIAMPGRLAINVSAQQMEDPEIVGRMLEIVHEAGATPEWLELELTESSMMSDPEHAIEIMQFLAAAGFGLSIDDFGTGYSSLSYLKRFSADEIKIDMSFVRNMLNDKSDYAIVNTIIAMAHSLGMSTTAEGVELEGQAEALKAMGCEIGQGYFFSRPDAPENFSEKWLHPPA